MESENSKQKYKMFRNYMANELGIGREDIMQWTKEAVESEVKKIVGQMDISGITLRTIRSEINSTKETIARNLAARITGQIKLDLDIKD